ncbi:hypothetical protein Emag_003619 [Eimeria magna]
MGLLLEAYKTREEGDSAADSRDLGSSIRGTHATTLFTCGAPPTQTHTSSSSSSSKSNNSSSSSSSSRLIENIIGKLFIWFLTVISFYRTAWGPQPGGPRSLRGAPPPSPSSEGAAAAAAAATAAAPAAAAAAGAAAAAAASRGRAAGAVVYGRCDSRVNAAAPVAAAAAPPTARAASAAAASL